MPDVDVVELDGRRRASLGKVGRKQDTRYFADTHEDGTIVLTPAVLMSATEANLLREHPDLVERIQAEIASGKRSKRPRR